MIITELGSEVKTVMRGNMAFLVIWIGGLAVIEINANDDRGSAKKSPRLKIISMYHLTQTQSVKTWQFF